MSNPYFNLFAMLDEFQEMVDKMCHPDMFMSEEDQPNTLPSCNPPDEDGPDPDQLFLALMTSSPVVIEETVETAVACHDLSELDTGLKEILLLL